MKFDQSVLFEHEKQCEAEGFRLIGGMDEVGRGPLAGPVVTACVIMDWTHPIPGIRDSKKVSEKKREALYETILEQAVSVGIGCVSEKEIDRINILQATRLAMKQAVENMETAPDLILVDAVTGLDIRIPYRSIIHGDAVSYSIAAASIVAKVYRDRLMREYDRMYPGYGFAANKGYGTAEHYQGIREHGICPIHRLTFLKSMENKT